ncbi:MAG: aminomethyltransferase [Parasphingorhabdus sp.]|jgi:aminomethyltransferase
MTSIAFLKLKFKTHQEKTMASPRQSILASRHKALGSDLGDWNDMDVAWSYNQDVNEEHLAVRNTAGLFDVSGLKKIHITGPDAVAVADHVITRDLTEIPHGKSVYALILNEEGRFTDDCIVYNIAPNHLFFVHGGGTAMEQLQKSAEGKDVDIQFDDNIHNISCQGPKSLDVLNPHTPFDLESLKYFHQVSTTLFGHSCMISRTGFSGERGYEIFVKGEYAGDIWDKALATGKEHGLMACSFNALDQNRVEAALLFYPFDMNEEHSAWETGLHFAVSKNKKADYRGKEASNNLIGKDKIRCYGIECDYETAVDEDAELFQGDKKVGVVTAPAFSPVLKKSLALVRIDTKLAIPGLEVEVRGPNITCKATTHDLPYYDPKKDRRTT